MFKHILVPTDGSALCQMSVERAISFAKDACARITFLCVEKQFPTSYVGLGAISDVHEAQRFHEIVDSQAHEVLDPAEKLALEAGVDCAKLVLISGSPFEAIIEAATRKECDLIFMASHGRSGVTALLLGSETQKVLSHSKIPVLVYR